MDEAINDLQSLISKLKKDNDVIYLKMFHKKLTEINEDIETFIKVQNIKKEFDDLSDNKILIKHFNNYCEENKVHVDTYDGGYRYSHESDSFITFGDFQLNVEMKYIWDELTYFITINEYEIDLPKDDNDTGNDNQLIKMYKKHFSKTLISQNELNKMTKNKKNIDKNIEKDMTIEIFRKFVYKATHKLLRYALEFTPRNVQIECIKKHNLFD
jgi:hypothetical protein